MTPEDYVFEAGVLKCAGLQEMMDKMSKKNFLQKTVSFGERYQLLTKQIELQADTKVSKGLISFIIIATDSLF